MRTSFSIVRDAAQSDPIIERQLGDLTRLVDDRGIEIDNSAAYGAGLINSSEVNVSDARGVCSG